MKKVFLILAFLMFLNCGGGSDGKGDICDYLETKGVPLTMEECYQMLKEFCGYGAGDDCLQKKLKSCPYDIWNVVICSGKDSSSQNECNNLCY